MSERWTMARRRPAALPALAAAGLLALAAGCDDRRPEEAAPPDAPAAGEPTASDTVPGGGGREAVPDTIPYDFSAAQWGAVSAFLRDHPSWSLVTAEANTNPLLERWQEERPGYRPYFLEGDLTADGKEDFALVFDADDGWRVAWFRATDGGYARTEPLIPTDWLAEGGLFLQEGDLVLGEFYTDRLETYRWDGERGRLVHHVPDAPELRS